MQYAQEFWTTRVDESKAAQSRAVMDRTEFQPDWFDLVQKTLKEATLSLPASASSITTSKVHLHSEHLSFLLSEMQSLARQYPQCVW